MIGKFVVEQIAKPLCYYSIGGLCAYSVGFNFVMAHPMADRYTQTQIERLPETIFPIGGAMGLIIGGYVGQLGLVYGLYTLNNYAVFKKHKP